MGEAHIWSATGLQLAHKQQTSAYLHQAAHLSLQSAQETLKYPGN